MTIRDVISCVEHLLESWCIEQGSPPSPGDDGDAFEMWFIWCAERLDRATRDELTPLATDALEVRRDRLRQALEELNKPFSDVLVPAVGKVLKHDDGVILYGDSYWDALAAPRSIFQLLSRLDGETPWREALAKAQEVSEDDLDEELVLYLAKAGALLPPGYGEQPLLLLAKPADDDGGMARATTKPSEPK